MSDLIKETKQVVNMPTSNMKLLLEDILDRGVAPNYILDVGANFGNWTRMAKEVFPQSVIYMIEPLSEMETYLKKITENFPETKYFPCGAGRKNENHVITTWGDNLAEANCVVPENEYLKSINKQRIVPIKTIDSLIENDEIKIPELVKMDIQGFELEALNGSSKLFGKTEVFILETALFEFTKGRPLLSEIVIFMREKGYEIYDLCGFLRRPYDGAMAQIDVCFAKHDGILRNSNAWVKPE